MALVLNKYKIFNPAMAYTGPNGSGEPVKMPESIEAGSTFEVIGIDMSGFILKELESGIKIQFNSDVFNQGFYTVNG
mgnify:CR=1 FL=1|jgi:hypothetical protein